ncbi:MAG: carbohydrate kinase [Clostridiales bacterium]|nr:carbohydrate kinase [Clostridiales bacterium]
MAKYFMGIDNGGTMTKAAVFDHKGNEVAVASVETPTISPQENFQERDMMLLWEATKTAIRNALKKAAIDPADIKAVGCTGHGKGIYLWGQDGKPAYHAIASTDHRGTPFIEAWRKDGTLQKAKEKTLQNAIDCQPVAILAWFRENKPEVLRNTKWIFEAKDYIRFMLTGEAYAEMTDYSGTSLMNLKTKCFDRELMSLFHLEDLFDCLPPLKNSYDNCGYITAEVAEQTGLAEGTPVCGGMFDIDACAIAMDVSREEQLCVITGTWSINEYISKTPISPESTTLNSLFCLPDYYLIEESSPTSAGNLEWVVDTLLDKEKAEAKAAGKSIYQYVDELVAQIPPESSHVLFLPFLYGTNSDYQSGAFLGLSNSNNKGELFRAVFEGVAFSHMTHIEKLLQLREQPKAIRIAGGVTNSKVWLQIFADVIGIPLEVVSTKELGTLGCAMAGAVSAGEYADYSAAAKDMVRLSGIIEPDYTLHKIYMEKYEQYKRVLTALKEI